MTMSKFLSPLITIPRSKMKNSKWWTQHGGYSLLNSELFIQTAHKEYKGVCEVAGYNSKVENEKFKMPEI